MTVTEIQVRTELGPWRDRWDELVLEQPVPSPFQRSWWLQAVAPAGVEYVLVTRRDELIGGLALGSRRTGGLDRLTAPGPAVLCPDHLDALVAPGEEAAVQQALTAWFCAPGQRLVDVRGVAASGLLARVVGGSHDRHDEAPYGVVTPGEDWLPTRSRNFRRSVRRGRGRLEEAGLRHHRLEGADVRRGLEELRRLHEHRAGRGALLRALPALSAAVEAGAARGEARVDVLTGAGQTASVVVSFVVGGRLSLYQVARSVAPEHDSAGTVLLAAVIEDAVASGCGEIDMLRGSEGYKAAFVDDARPLERVRAARGAWASARLAAEDSARSLNARLRSRGGTGA